MGNRIGIAVGAVALAFAAVASAANLAGDIWFCADFDRPPVMAGRMIDHDAPPDALVEGRHGKACFFRRAGRNVLPPMEDFLATTNAFDAPGGAMPVGDPAAGTLSFAGGEFAIRPRGAGMPSHWVNKDTSSTLAFEIRGEKGAEVTVTPLCPPLTEAQIEAIRKGDKDFDPGKCLPDTLEPRTFKLTGDWLRVWNFAAVDIRQRMRPVGWKIATTGPVAMRKFLMEPTGTFPYGGIRFPTEWVDGGQKRGEYALQVGDGELLSSFPVSNGTFCCWMKTPEDWTLPDRDFTVFKYWGKEGPAGCEWSLSRHFFNDGSPYTLRVNMPPRTNAWRHVAATWTKDALKFYLDGAEFASVPNPKLLDVKGARSFALGGGGYASADMALDDVAIFSRALDAGEIAALARADSGLRDAADLFIAGIASPPVFPRNQENAALKLSVDSPVAGDFSLELTVGDRRYPKRKVALARGANAVAAPFRSADFAAVRKPWRVRLLREDGSPATELSGTLTILPRFERDGFRFLSWGLGPVDFLLETGLNAGVAYASSPDDAKRAAEAGLHLVLRVENADAWRTANFDAEKIKQSVERLLEPYAGLPMWDATLVNSETYSVAAVEAGAGFSKWQAMAKKELGHDPVVAFTHSPCGVNWEKAGGSPYGVLARNDAYDTLVWAMRRGMPNFFVNRVNRSVIHRLSPGNIVWSEPTPSPEDLDMTADWIYNYDPFRCLHMLRFYEAVPRSAGKRYMPTLAMGYWSPDYPEVTDKHPAQRDKDGKPVSVMMGQTCDELAIKTWMAIGGSAADGISYFSADWSWGQAMTNGVLHEKGLPLVYSPGWQKHCLAEKDCAPRFGRLVRERIAPAARLLRGIRTDPAPIALLLPDEIGYSGVYWWPRVTFIRRCGDALAKLPVPYDVLTDGEFDTATLERYSYVLYPQLNCITPEHDRVLREVRGVKFLADTGYRPKTPEFTYPNIENLPGWNNNYPWPDAKVDDPLNAFFLPETERLRGRLFAWSEEDGTNAWTFCKTYRDAHFVTVVNNLRRAGGCPQTDIHTNATYRPMGAPQRIATHLPGTGAIYEFDAEGGDHRVKPVDGVVVRDYRAATARVFCVYPKELAKPVLSLEGRPVPGGDATLKVAINDIDGRPAPGRQVVRLTLTDPKGAVMDESGLYTVEDGRASIPIRLAANAEKGGLLAKWRILVEDLTTGLAGKTTF